MQFEQSSESRWWISPVLPLRWHLVLLLAGTVLPLILFATLVLLRFADQHRQAAARRLVHSARLLARALEWEIDGSQRVLSGLAASPLLSGDELRSFDAEARRIAAAQPSWMAVVLLAPDGRQLVNTLRPWGTPLPPVLERQTFEDALRSGKPAVAPVTRTRDGRWAFAVRVPVLRNGRLRYVLTAAISTEGLSRIVAAQLPSDQEWTRTIVDHRGIVAARTRSPERFVGQPASATFIRRTGAQREGVYQDTSLDGAPVYVGFSRTASSGWTVAVTAPAESVEGPLRSAVLPVAALGLLLLTVSGGGAFVLSRRVAREIHGAAAAAQSLARGRLPEAPRASVAEIARLHHALQSSAELLSARERERDEHLRRAEEARREAEASNEAKDQFLALLGHELRNPLAPIITTLSLVEARGALRPRDLEILLRQSRHLSTLVDDLLDVSRIARGAVELKREPLELRGAVDTALEMVAPLVEERQHRVTVEVPVEGLRVMGDRVRLTQVVSNLLTNAARYTPPGGQISVAARRVEEQIELSVTDNGVGLAPELAPRVFEMFVQGVRSIDRREGGLGLGLTIVRSLVRLHGGTVDVESAGPGQGATFRVRLPAWGGREEGTPSR